MFTMVRTHAKFQTPTSVHHRLPETINAVALQ